MTTGLDTSRLDDSRVYDHVAFTKGWEVLSNIVERLPDAESHIYVTHLDDKNEVARVQHIETRVTQNVTPESLEKDKKH